LAKLLSDVFDGKIESATATVGQLLDAWLDQIEPTRALSTMQEYRRKLRLSVRPAFGSIVLSKLRPHQIDAQYRKWLNQGLSPTTVRHYYAILSAACNQAVQMGLDRAIAGPPRLTPKRDPADHEGSDAGPTGPIGRRSGTGRSGACRCDRSRRLDGCRAW